MRQECRERFPRLSGLAIPACITARARLTCRDACRDFLWNRWQGKRPRHSRRMRNPHFYESGKRPMVSFRWLLSVRFTISSTRFNSLNINKFTNTFKPIEAAYFTAQQWNTEHIDNILMHQDVILMISDNDTMGEINVNSEISSCQGCSCFCTVTTGIEGRQVIIFTTSCEE